LGYTADAARLEPGSIVKIEKPLSSSGKPTYPHFFVVLSVPHRPQPGDSIPLVRISSRVDPASVDPAKHVAMKWLNRKGGDPETGFQLQCFACMDFTHILTVYKGDRFAAEVHAEYSGRFVRAEKLQILVATMNAWIRKHDRSR
jgi:hypothetical protein